VRRVADGPGVSGRGAGGAGGHAHAVGSVHVGLVTVGPAFAGVERDSARLEFRVAG
jgi:hypothetical protein